MLWIVDRFQCRRNKCCGGVSQIAVDHKPFRLCQNKCGSFIQMICIKIQCSGLFYQECQCVNEQKRGYNLRLFYAIQRFASLFCWIRLFECGTKCCHIPGKNGSFEEKWYFREKSKLPRNSNLTFRQLSFAKLLDVFVVWWRQSMKRWKAVEF